VLIHVKLQIGKGDKITADWVKTVKEAKVNIVV